MQTLETVGLLTLAAMLWLWFDGLRAREAGKRAAQAACDADGLQFLDDTVALRSFWTARDDDGRLRLKRVYAFEYSDTGDNRRQGTVTLLGSEVLALNLGPRLVSSL